MPANATNAAERHESTVVMKFLRLRSKMYSARANFRPYPPRSSLVVFSFTKALPWHSAIRLCAVWSAGTRFRAATYRKAKGSSHPPHQWSDNAFQQQEPSLRATMA
jgi:hypothetical protein